MTFPDLNSKSAALFERARRVMPGANTRHMITFGPYIVYGAHGQGCRLTDVDGNVYLDWVNDFSVQIHGYGYRPIVEAVKAQAERMLCCILPGEAEVELAEIITSRLSGVEQIRFANSGTEAVMVALKGARGLTGRSKIAKTEGGYHGQYDLVEASFLPTPENWGPAQRPAAPAFAPGTPQSLLDQAVILPFNDTESTLAILEEQTGQLAAVIIDPIPARLGFVQGDRAYLQALRDYCTRTGTVLVFDEVITGFRVCYGGAQTIYKIKPDLTVLGKIIGGGLPIGAIGGTRAAMSVFDNLSGPLKVSHSGTFTGNPMSMVAGIASLKGLTPDVFERLARQGDRLRSGMATCFRDAGLTMQASGAGSMSSLQLFTGAARSYREFHLKSGPGYLQRMQKLHRQMLNEGVLIATRGLMVGSTPMTDADIDETLERAGRALRRFADQDKAAA